MADVPHDLRLSTFEFGVSAVPLQDEATSQRGGMKDEELRLPHGCRSRACRAHIEVWS